MRIIFAGLIALSVFPMVTGCGGGEVDRDVPLSARLTSEAATRGVPPLPTVTTGPASAASTIPAPVSPIPQATLDAATLAQINNLRRFVLAPADLGADFEVQRSERSFRASIVEAQSGIPELASFLNTSSLQGAWGALYARTVEPAGTLSSIVYLFATPQDAQAFVAAYGAIETTDYIGAIEVQALPAPALGDVAFAVRFRTTSGRSLEVVWTQGQLAGHVILRHSTDSEDPADQDAVAGLALIQAMRMADALQ